MRYGILLCAVCGYQISADKWPRHCNGCMPGVQASAPYRAIMDNILVRIDDGEALRLQAAPSEQGARVSMGHWVRVNIVDEAYTSKTCGCCGVLNETLGGSKKFHCKSCGTAVDRDVNEARNIATKNHQEW